MDIAQILRGHMAFWVQEIKVKASGGKPLKVGGFFYIFRCQCQRRHEPKNVQWPPISLWLNSLGLNILYKTSPPSANRAVVQKL